jgi:hypothetical protein
MFLFPSSGPFNPAKKSLTLSQPVLLYQNFLAEKEHIDKYLRTWETLPEKLAIKGKNQATPSIPYYPSHYHIPMCDG